MKKATQLKSLLVSMAIASSAAMTFAPSVVQAGASANIGVVSQYIFRGIAQNGTSAAAQGGLDYEADSGLYVGTWASQVGPSKGLEYDLYGGYSGSFGELTYGLGATYFGYTKNGGSDGNAFDSSYLEGTLSVGYGPVSASYSSGTHAKLLGGSDVNYSVATIGVEFAGISATYGMGDDFAGKGVDHSWIDIGYSTSIAEGTDIGINLINSDKKVSGYTNGVSGAAEDNMSLVVGITKSFDL